LIANIPRGVFLIGGEPFFHFSLPLFLQPDLFNVFQFSFFWMIPPVVRFGIGSHHRLSFCCRSNVFIFNRSYPPFPFLKPTQVSENPMSMQGRPHFSAFFFCLPPPFYSPLRDGPLSHRLPSRVFRQGDPSPSCPYFLEACLKSPLLLLLTSPRISFFSDSSAYVPPSFFVALFFLTGSPSPGLWSVGH